MNNYSLGQKDSALLSYGRFVVQDDVVPRHAEELKNLRHRLLRMKYQPLVVDRKTVFAADRPTLLVHRGHDPVPVTKGPSVGPEVEALDRDLPRDDRVDRGATVSDHQQELGAREDPVQTVDGAQGKRVLVTEAGSCLSVTCDDAEDVGSESPLKDLVAEVHIAQPVALEVRLVQPV